jgi:hypothetical protein
MKEETDDDGYESIDEIKQNADWPKRSPDTMEALEKELAERKAREGGKKID